MFIIKIKTNKIMLLEINIYKTETTKGHDVELDITLNLNVDIEPCDGSAHGELKLLSILDSELELSSSIGNKMVKIEGEEKIEMMLDLFGIELDSLILQDLTDNEYEYIKKITED